VSRIFKFCIFVSCISSRPADRIRQQQLALTDLDACHHLAFLSHPLGLEATYAVYLRLNGKRVVDLLVVTNEVFYG